MQCFILIKRIGQYDANGSTTRRNKRVEDNRHVAKTEQYYNHINTAAMNTIGIITGPNYKRTVSVLGSNKKPASSQKKRFAVR